MLYLDSGATENRYIEVVTAHFHVRYASYAIVLSGLPLSYLTVSGNPCALIRSSLSTHLNQHRLYGESCKEWGAVSLGHTVAGADHGTLRIYNSQIRKMELSGKPTM